MELGLPELGGLGEKLAKVKLPDLKMMGVVAGVLLVICFFWWLFSKQSVEQRSEALATAIKKLDMDAAVAMSMPGTELQAMKWVGERSKEYTDLKLAIGNLEPGVQVKVQEGSDGASAQSLIVFSREGATSTGPLSVEQAASLEPASNEKKKSMELVVFWAKDTWQTWRLDGKRTLENPSRP